MAILGQVGALQWAQLVRQLGVLATAVLLAHTGLPASHIGRYELLQYLTALLSAAWISGLTQGLLTLWPKVSAVEQKNLLSWVVVSYSILSLLVAVVIGLMPSRLLQWLSGQEILHYQRWFALFLVGYLPSLLFEYVLFLHGRYRSVVLYSTLNALGWLACLVLPPAMGYSFSLSFQLLAMLASFRLLQLWIYTSRHVQLGNLRWDLLRRWLTIAAPITGYALLGIINLSVDSWWIGQLYAGDTAMLAVYRYGAREIPLATALTAAAGAALLPQLSGALHETLPLVRRQSAKLCHQFYPLAILLTATSAYWYPWVFGAAFAESAVIFNYFVLIGGSRVVLSLALVTATQMHGPMLRAALISLFMHIALSGWLGSHWGAVGVAAGTTISFIAEKAMLTYFVYQKQGIRPGAYLHLPVWTAYTAALLLAFAVSLF